MLIQVETHQHIKHTQPQQPQYLFKLQDSYIRVNMIVLL